MHIGSTMVEQLPHLLKVDGSSSALVAKAEWKIRLNYIGEQKTPQW